MVTTPAGTTNEKMTVEAPLGAGTPETAVGAQQTVERVVVPLQTEAANASFVQVPQVVAAELTPVAKQTPSVLFPGQINPDMVFESDPRYVHMAAGWSATIAGANSGMIDYPSFFQLATRGPRVVQ